MTKQYSIEELSFALKIRDLAARLRDSEMPARFLEAPDGGEERSEWLAYHPVSMYVPKAIQLVTQVADQIHTMNEVHDED